MLFTLLLLLQLLVTLPALFVISLLPMLVTMLRLSLINILLVWWQITAVSYRFRICAVLWIVFVATRLLFLMSVFRFLVLMRRLDVFSLWTMLPVRQSKTMISHKTKRVNEWLTASTSTETTLWQWLSSDALVLINVVSAHRARLILGWVTVYGVRAGIPSQHVASRLGQLSLPSL